MSTALSITSRYSMSTSRSDSAGREKSAKKNSIRAPSLREKALLIKGLRVRFGRFRRAPRQRNGRGMSAGWQGNRSGIERIDISAVRVAHDTPRFWRQDGVIRRGHDHDRDPSSDHGGRQLPAARLADRSREADPSGTGAGACPRALAGARALA